MTSTAGGWGAVAATAALGAAVAWWLSRPRRDRGRAGIADPTNGNPTPNPSLAEPVRAAGATAEVAGEDGLVGHDGATCFVCLEGGRDTDLLQMGW